jgi:hypothetical protein
MAIDPGQEVRVVMERMGAVSGRFTGGQVKPWEVTASLHVLVSGRGMAAVPAGLGRIHVQGDGRFVVGPLLTGMPVTVVMEGPGQRGGAVKEIGEPAAGETRDVGEVKFLAR